MVKQSKNNLKYFHRIPNFFSQTQLPSFILGSSLKQCSATKNRKLQSEHNSFFLPKEGV